MSRNVLSNQQRAYDFIRADVLVDPDTQGTFLNEQALAERLGMSRTPIREALRKLASDGLVQMVPNRGTFVPPITRKQVRELFEFRLILEQYAASSALRQNGSAAADSMGRLLAQQRALINGTAENSQLGFIAIDSDFHVQLLRETNNDEIIATYDRLQTRQRILGARALDRQERRASVCEEHETIVAALRDGDERRAHEAIERHLRVTESIILEHSAL